MKIRKFYGSHFWKKQRKYRLLMDNYVCSQCGGVATEVHHKIRLTNKNVDDLKISSLENLESICRGCHNKQTHSLKDPYKFNVDGDLIN